MTSLGWALTLATIAALLALDLVVSARRSGPVGLRVAGAWSVFYVGVALAFGVILGVASGWVLGTQYFAGYVVEKSLSVDNLFVFVIIVAAFAVPPAQQSRALTIGIAMALVMRAVFIALGAALLNAFSFMFAIFGLGLLFSAVQLLRHRDREPAVLDGRLVAAVRRRVPVSDAYAGGRLTTRVDGRRTLTPLALVLVALAGTDVLFALDSIPAVFGVTDHAYVVFCANAFALLGLRALFFLVSGLLERLVYLAFGLSLVLAFIGVKLILEFVHHEVSGVPVIATGASLAVIVIVLAVTAAASLLRPRASSDPEGEVEVAHSDADELAGSVAEGEWTAGRPVNEVRPTDGRQRNSARTATSRPCNGCTVPPPAPSARADMTSARNEP
jgi:tellurite resistance protein TerC